MARVEPKTQFRGVRFTAAGLRGAPKGFNGGERILPAIFPNSGTGQKYQRALEKLISDMHASVDYWVRAKYRANAPEIAQDAARRLSAMGLDPLAADVMHAREIDGHLINAPLKGLMALDASPAAELRRLMRKLARRWQRRFDTMAQKMAEEFAKDAQDRSQAALQGALREAGWALKFRPTRAQNDVFQAVVGENVGLIKSIPQQYLQGVEGEVMRSVAKGGDLQVLTDALEERYGVTRRRAELIARDQNNKANAVFTRVRQQELGITEAIWVHSHGGKEPRASHVTQSGKRYSVQEGWYDPEVGEYIRPGELINCRCVSRSVVRGLS